MTDYAAKLLDTTNTWASAYLEYKTGFRREGYSAYAFVEDDDDISFYQHALKKQDNLCYLGCGGKTGVIAVYEKLTEETLSSGNLFFVDKDTEEEPFELADHILRTTLYSWESHVCEPKYVVWYSQRKLKPNLSRVQMEALEDGWLATLEAFKSLLCRQASLCSTALEIGTSLGVGDLNLTEDFIATGTVISPGPKSGAWYQPKLKLAASKGALIADIESKCLLYSHRPVFEVARGKTLFAILRIFFKNCCNFFKCSIRGEWNSAKFWLEAMPWTNDCLEYIRNYADRRLVKAHS